MPYVGLDTEPKQFDLKTVPGAYVKVRRMSYGDKLARQSMSKLGIEMSGKSKDIKGELAMANREITYMDFSRCVVEHNLFKDRDETVPYNFNNSMDIDALDPRVGEEIDKYINEMNNFEDSDDAKN